MFYKLFDEKPWFRPHRFGIGATPNTPEGWLFTGLYLLFLCGMGFALKGNAGHPSAAWWIGIGAVTALFVLVCWRKTEGGWRWRWGK